MKIVFEMADTDWENKDFLLQALDFEKAFIFNDIMENCVPLSKVLDDIKAEMEQLPKTYPFVNHQDMYVKEDDVKKIIDKHKAEGSEE